MLRFQWDALRPGDRVLVHNDLADCGNNGIQVWRSEPGEDGSIVTGNRIVRIRADSGGTGENGNGVNVLLLKLTSLWFVT